MNKIQSNQRAMNLAVKNVFNKNTKHVQSLPALNTLVTEFDNNLTEINNTLLVQEGKITGVTEQKQKEEKEMIGATIRVASAIYVYAIDNSDFELAEKVNLSPSALEHMTQASLQAACTNVLEIAKEHVEHIPIYGITSGDISSLQKEIGDYVSLAVGPRTQIVTRSQATTRLRELMKKQMDLLNLKADKLMVMFKTTRPVFYNEYKSARIIVNMGMRHNMLQEAEEISNAS